VDAAKGETVDQWFDRYYKVRAAKPRGAESVSDSRSRYKNWIAPSIGPMAMVDVRREHLEALVEELDRAAAEEEIGWKTAANIWGEITAGFRVATSGEAKFWKDKSLRVLDTNPGAERRGP
jgi:hypothetical protein